MKAVPSRLRPEGVVWMIGVGSSFCAWPWEVRVGGYWLGVGHPGRGGGGLGLVGLHLKMSSQGAGHAEEGQQDTTCQSVTKRRQ